MAVVKINALDVPEGAGEEIEKRFAARAEAMNSVPGFLGFELLRPVGGESRYFVYTRWESDEAFKAWGSGPAAGAAHAGSRQPVSTGANLLEFEVALSMEPKQA
ncbi:antibiotic biosynthesis monooxygenase family protein [Kutzneria sp. CA-103260]|uniref:antibiotic biosynthesis monooxygenase family protein n=1 Tax=Kutzneria sp. CA-103260 TaxID=2802641 RepID=UPI001BAE4E30|nr:antibiotic biosynthesis monooxygenase [Kutzneria sp. CA-103260]QUQ62412.1 antibiotic biosynthesis monooxygenase [Kutzneria sp. CA-103260]